MLTASRRRFQAIGLIVSAGLAFSAPATAQMRPDDGSVLPFPEPPMGGSVGETLADSVHRWRERPSRIPENAPNIVIVMLDDSGYGQAELMGGPVAMPTLDRLADEGIVYTALHTTAMCSPTRASLLTGRNHHRVGNGQIAEFANDWDGYTGVIPRSSATIAEVLGHYGYVSHPV